MNHADPNVGTFARTLVQLRRAIVRAESSGEGDEALKALRTTEQGHPYNEPAVIERAKEIARMNGEDLWPNEL